ncbi:MAG: SCO family protein [Vicinamibacterales bacterium]
MMIQVALITRLARAVRTGVSVGVCLTILGVGGAWAQTPNFLSGFNNDKSGIVSSERPAILKDVSFSQRLNEQLPLDASFLDESGRRVQLGEYFGGTKPVILAFVYYQCPMLCIQVMNGISSSLRALSFEAGKDFDVVLVSFDPRDTPAAAAEKKRTHLDYWAAQSTASGWHLLTGDEATIARVTQAAGFSYQWDDLTQQFAHVSGVLVVTPEGRLSRYFYGVEYSPKELRLALVESGQGNIGSVIDELLLYCYHYDPASGRYGVIVMNLIRAGGVLTVAFILGVMFLTRRRDSHTPLEGRT